MRLGKYKVSPEHNVTKESKKELKKKKEERGGEGRMGERKREEGGREGKKDRKKECDIAKGIGAKLTDFPMANIRTSAATNK